MIAKPHRGLIYQPRVATRNAGLPWEKPKKHPTLDAPRLRGDARPGLFRKSGASASINRWLRDNHWASLAGLGRKALFGNT